MLDSPITVFSEAINIRPPLLQPGGGVDVNAAADVAITSVKALYFGYMLFLKITCTAAATTAGDFTLKDAVGGTVLQKFTQPDPGAGVGAEYCFPFPHPWKTAVVAGVFAMACSVATMGTWRVNVNGFYSTL